MRKIAFVVVLLAACGRKHPVPAPPAALTIAITHDGFVKVDGKAVTLDELGTLLAARRALSWGVKASPLPILLDVEDEALWRHVSWVMTVAAEGRFWRLTLPGGRDVPLPVDWTMCGGGPPPDGKALLVRVFVLEDGTYVLGDHTTRDAQEIGAWTDAAPRRGILCRIGQIRGQPRVAWRLVRPAFDVLRGRGVKRIDAIEIPPREYRATSPLPLPHAWKPRGPGPPPRGLARWSGFRVVDYWSGTDSYEELDVEVPEELVALLDAHRRGLGLPAFGAEETLGNAASLHAAEMDRMGYFGHFSPVPANRSPSDRLASVGWPEERRHAELLAKADDAKQAFAAILARPESTAVLADPAFKYAGVARSGDCWVVVLGAER